MSKPDKLGEASADLFQRQDGPALSPLRLPEAAGDHQTALQEYDARLGNAQLVFDIRLGLNIKFRAGPR